MEHYVQAGSELKSKFHEELKLGGQIDQPNVLRITDSGKIRRYVAHATKQFETELGRSEGVTLHAVASATTKAVTCAEILKRNLPVCFRFVVVHCLVIL